MKRLISLFLILTCFWTFVGCSNKVQDYSYNNLITEQSVNEFCEVLTSHSITSEDIDILLKFAVLEDPDAMKKNWTYCITYNPKEKATNGTEMMVLFYGDYIKIDDKCYVPSDDAEYKKILSWAKNKFDYSMPTE